MLVLIKPILVTLPFVLHHFLPLDIKHSFALFQRRLKLRALFHPLAAFPLRLVDDLLLQSDPVKFIVKKLTIRVEGISPVSVVRKNLGFLQSQVLCPLICAVVTVRLCQCIRLCC